MALPQTQRKLRTMALVKPNGVLRGTRQLNQSDRQVEHRKMRQTWMQTFAGFAILNAMLAGAFWYFGALSILGIFGGIWITVILIAWFFSAKITPMAVQAYAADPSTEYGAAAIRCADRAWEQLTAHVRENYGERVVSLMKRPPVMLAPNKHANAFCTGRGWRNSVIVIFEGAFLSGMTEDEIVAVLGHELGHFFHLDVFMQTVASVLGAILSLTIAGAAKKFVQPLFARLPRWLRWLSFLSNIALLFSLRVTGTLLKVVQMFISRAREASADAFGAEITDDPCALARALKKLVAYETKLAKQEALEAERARLQDPVKYHARETARICEEAVLDALGIMLFIDTLQTVKHAAGEKRQPSWLGAWWERLMENHPPIEERCKWLELAAGHACPCPGVDDARG
ncbi:MAG: M48 family metalloprotease [Candidatus Obscuribacterales bacterium]|nr:M48 family metalloprotease [Candidatus Obscuribacterales bacterium]